MAKSKQKGNIELPTEEELFPKKKRSSGYSKRKGSAYERKIAQELRDLGFTGVVTSRSESKSTDDNKVDLIDTEDKLPIKIQLKATQTIPSYFKIRSESTVDPEEFVIIWSKQEKREVNIVSVGEVAIMDKALLYKLIKPFAEGKA